MGKREIIKDSLISLLAGLGVLTIAALLQEVLK